MGKYTPLEAYLEGIPLRQDRVVLSFAEVEKIIDDRLPPSAHKYGAWWANEREVTHVQANAWLRAGWQVESVHLERQVVIFTRQFRD